MLFAAKSRADSSRGSLTVEATLILPIVLISWFTIINLLNIYLLQAGIQQALNSTAQRISEYCYLLERVDMLDDVADIMNMSGTTTQKSSKLKESFNDMGTHAQKIGDELSNFSISSIQTIVDEAHGFSESAQNAYEVLKNVTEEDLTDYFLSELSNVGGGTLMGLFVNQYISDLQINTRDLSELDYTKSKFLYGNDQEFTLVVTYTYHNPLSIKFFSEVEMAQMVTMRPWVGDVGTGLKDLAGS